MLTLTLSLMRPETPAAKDEARLKSQLTRLWPAVPLGMELATQVYVSTWAETDCLVAVRGGKALEKKLNAARDRVKTFFDWLAKQPRKAWFIQLAAPEATEREFIAVLSRLEALGVSRVEVSLPDAATSACLAPLAHVTHLALDAWSVPRLDLRPLAKFANLEALRLFGPRNDEDPVDLTMLTKCSKLEQLSLKVPSVELAAPASLRDLALCKVKKLSSPKLALRSIAIRGLTPAMLKFVKCADEVSLWMENSDPKTPSVDLSKLDTLVPRDTRRLALMIDQRRADHSARPVSRLTQLRSLLLSGSFKDVASLSTLEQLEELQVPYLPRPDRLDVSRLKHLARVDAHGVTLKGWPR